MRRVGIWLLVGLLCGSAGLVAIAPSQVGVAEAQTQRREISYVGSARSNKYHYPTCVWAGKIKSSNLVSFSSPEHAQRSGYVPCKVCKPPLQSAR